MYQFIEFIQKRF